MRDNGSMLFFLRPRRMPWDMHWTEFRQKHPEAADAFARWAKELYEQIGIKEGRADDVQELVEENFDKNWLFRPMPGRVIEANPNVILEDIPPVYWHPNRKQWYDSASESETIMRELDTLLGYDAVFGIPLETPPIN